MLTTQPCQHMLTGQASGIVVDDVDAAVAFFTDLGMEPDLCYLRGPTVIIVALAERIG